MEIGDEVKVILSDAEEKLNALIARALHVKNHSEVQRLSKIAQRVAAAGDILMESEDLAAETLKARTVTPTESVTFSVEAKTYPRFYRAERDLIKIGYSKTDRRTYEHRAPKELLERLTAVVSDIGNAGKQFTTELILPPEDMRLSDVPSYQVYLCLAFLVLNGLVQKHGRSGYTIAREHAKNLPAGLNAKWNELTIR